MKFGLIALVRGDRGVLLVPTRNSCSDHAMTAPTHSPSWNSYSRLSMDSGSLRVLFVGDRNSGSSATFHERFLSLAKCIARANQELLFRPRNDSVTQLAIAECVFRGFRWTARFLAVRFLWCVCLHCLCVWLPVLALRVYLVACACPACNWLLVLVLPA